MKALKPLTMILLGGFLMFAGYSYFTSPAYFIPLTQAKKKQVLNQASPYLEELIIESKSSGKHIFKIEIADTPKNREYGLMFREHLNLNQGMLFKLKQTKVAKLWMKNTLIPLDMVFIAPDGLIKKIHENAVPYSLESISSGVPVSAVLEINGGRAKALGFTVGDKVIHPYFVE